VSKRDDELDKLLSDETDPEDLADQVRGLREENRRLRGRIKSMMGGTAVAVGAINAWLEENPPRIPATPLAKTARASKRRNLHLLVHASDWQVGAAGPGYDTGKARESVDLLIHKLGRLTDDVYGRERFASARLVVGGDMVDGSGKRPGHAWDVDSDVMAQAMNDAPSMIAKVYRSLCGRFPRVHAYSVRGNHGNEGGKRSLNPDRVNWDTVASTVSKSMVEDLLTPKTRTFDIEVETFYQIIEVGKTNVLSIHGDQFRGSGGFAGIPYYSIAAKAAKWADALPERWDILMFGHFHVPAFGMFGRRTWYLNGSTMPASPWALETLAATNRPAQRALVIHEERGVVADHVLYLDDDGL
jgi:predicted phosphodiesterase